MHNNSNRRSHSNAFSMPSKNYAPITLVIAHASEEQEAAAKKIFKHVGTVQQQMMQASMAYTGSYLVYNINWKPLGRQRIFPLKAVLKSLDAVAAFELVLCQQFPQHFTAYRGKPCINYDLVQVLYMRHWVK